MLRTSAYRAPPGSGNADARWFHERTLPAGPEGRDFLDSACLATAPLLGDVEGLPGVCVGYRQHVNQDTALFSDPSRFARALERARVRWAFAQRAAAPADEHSPVDDRPQFRSRELLKFRSAAARLTPATSELSGDSPRRRFADAMESLAWPGPEPLLALVGIACWSLLVACWSLLVAAGAVGRCAGW